MLEVTDHQHRAALQVIIGIDTHQEQHVAVAIDRQGVRRGERYATATTSGYRELERWSSNLGTIHAFGIEGTGSYGAGIARFLTSLGYCVVVVNRPDRPTRYRKGKSDPTAAAKYALRSLACRRHQLSEEIRNLKAELTQLIGTASPTLINIVGVGPDTAATLLIAAGSNPERLRSEAAFAALCGVCPIPASSGKTHRHRLNRGGDRQANAARRCTASSSSDFDATRERKNTCAVEPGREGANRKSCAASNGTSPARYSSTWRRPREWPATRLDIYRSILLVLLRKRGLDGYSQHALVLD